MAPFHLSILGIIVLAFGLLCMIEAQKKNRNQLGWFAAGVFFGVFGFIAILLMEKSCPNRNEREV